MKRLMCRWDRWELIMSRPIFRARQSTAGSQRRRIAGSGTRRCRPIPVREDSTRRRNATRGGGVSAHISGTAVRDAMPGVALILSKARNMRSLLRRSIEAAIVAGLLATGEAAAMDTIRFTGEGDEMTAPFKMDRPWRVEWRSEGRRLELILVQKDSEVESWLANLVGPGSGSTHYVEPGTYYFDVNAWGPWSVEVQPMAESGFDAKVPGQNPP